MGTVKTAISIPESLFQEADLLARQMEISRSELFAKAVQSFIECYKSRRILEELNHVYDDSPDEGEQKRLEKTKACYRKLVEGEW
jgi:metal-responsive CopG/Arc/MetJ family transcriptional regulator